MSATPETRSAYFRTRLTHDPRRAKVWRHLTSYLARDVPAGASVLELGAGYCHFINEVPAARRVAVDISPDVLQWKGDDVEGHAGDAISFLRDTPPNQFDFILASNFFEHFEWPALNEMVALILRVLKPGGRLAVIQPNFRLVPRRYFDDYTHRAIFTDVALNDWLRSAGFHVVRSIPRFLPFTLKSPLRGLSFLMPLYLRLPWRPLAGQMFVLAERPR
jgi:SAM-dependent methyltransferase